MHLFRHARVPTACLPSSLVIPPPPDLATEPWVECDILIDGTKIVGVSSSTGQIGLSSAGEILSSDLGGVIVWPGLLDVHTHLDKTHTWNRAPNPRGEFWDAIEILHRDAQTNWNAHDLQRRASFGLRSAWAHGTIALRTHLDSSSNLGHEAHAVLADLRASWADRVTIQTVSLCNLTSFSSGEASRIVELTARYGAAAMGGFPQPGPNLPAQLDYLLAAARELQLGVDLHVDESGLPHAECLRAVAEAVLRNAFPYPVTCGHNCSLAIHSDERAAETIALVKAAGIRIVALPLCNLYLQGRRWDHAGRPLTSHWRGLTRMHELIAAGVTVACASDNVRDAFFAWGDYDLFEVFNASVRVGHLDTRLAHAPSIVTTAPATIMNLPGYGTIGPGAPADLIVTSARSFSEFFARPHAPRRLVHGETFRTAELPDYAELSV